MELWRNIRGYEKYQVSNYGRVRSLKYGKVKILKQIKHTKGYLQVFLYKDGIAKTFLVHRLVWETFNGNIPEGMEVNHINEDKTDNRYPENLNIITHTANINWGTRTQKVKEKLSQAVLQLTYPSLELICEWPSVSEAGRNGFNQGAVCRCCNSKQKSHKGVTFRYKETYSVE